MRAWVLGDQATLRDGAGAGVYAGAKNGVET
jgi:hypothetical protein